MLDNKIKYILALLIILILSMNAFSATDFTDDSSDATLQSSPVDEVVGDGADDGAGDQADDSQNNEETNTNTDDTKPGTTSGGNGSGSGSSFDFSSLTGGNGSGSGSSFDFSSLTGGNGSGSGSSFDFSSLTGGNGTGNGTDFDIAQILDIFSKLMGGNATNATNETVNPEVSDVPEVVTSTSYAPVSQPAESTAQHFVQRLRDNVVVSTGDALRLQGINNLFDSDFTNGHLLVYVDGKLVFNEITAGDVSTPIFWISGDYLGQHQISVEFTPNGTSNTNKYTEDVYIA
ncbi:hypothetical protein [Methanobrevibacter sp.]|uniref:hypothetical protein n=1 Tax=Methanobrevibacter sp. TaxID=66852 RepID=UPI0025E42FDB|nr:hypothetical protein [Methanobrevibacter sp.]MBQ6511682.1 hypothetical protein [Methanobrevibacter sp.]